jgi:hypothetical protein
MTATCRSCRAPIWWCRTPTGRSIPVDPEPVSQGNLVVGERTAYAGRAARVLRSGEEPAEGETRHVSHFATCPDADRHRSAR